ncbi:unnamed protein product [Auanema sp. JU1783]|nr:unnamed protein product [Auanema sp. JU1783]
MVSLSIIDPSPAMLIASPYGLIEWPSNFFPTVIPSTTLTKTVRTDFKSDNDIRNKLGRNYNPGRPLALSVRQRILDLHEKGHKITHIARMIGVTHSCVSKIMSKYKQTGSVIPRSSRSYEAANDLIPFIDIPNISENISPRDDISKTITNDAVITSVVRHVEAQDEECGKLFVDSVMDETKGSTSLVYSIERLLA